MLRFHDYEYEEWNNYSFNGKTKRLSTFEKVVRNFIAKTSNISITEDTNKLSFLIILDFRASLCRHDAMQKKTTTTKNPAGIRDSVHDGH